MCLIVFDWQPGTRLRLVANRDEFHARPTAPLARWEDTPDIVGGRDLQAGGTWLGVAANGRFAATTNVRGPAGEAVTGRSRGQLVRDFLLAEGDPQRYIDALRPRAAEYPGFNLLLLAEGALWHYANRAAPGAHAGDGEATPLPAGIHGVSNAGLDTPWPKLRSACAALQALPPEAPETALADVTARREPFADDTLPDTGVGLELERLLSPPFIVSPAYGTRSTTVLDWRPQGANLYERRYASDGSLGGEARETIDFAGD